MLTRVYIDNFLCFVNFEYRPEIKQLLLGPNGSGKSSLLTAIRNLKQFVRGDENPFTQSTRTRWQDRPLQVFELAARLDDRDYEYRIEIQFAQETREQSVQLERLTVSGSPVFELTKGEIRFFPSNASSEPMAVPFRATKSALQLSQLSNLHVRRFVEWVETIHCFRIDVYPGAMDEIADNEEEQPDDELDNFAPWYRHLVQTYPEDNVLFLKSMKECLDGFQTLRFASDEDGTRKLWADFVGPRKRVSYKLSELSEGQRYLLALYAILHFAIAKRETVFVDEPDNFIALREIQPWLLAADQKVLDSGGQLILISHHPELLNQWASSYGLRFFREGNAQVRTEKFKSDPEGILQPSELIARGWE